MPQLNTFLQILIKSSAVVCVLCCCLFVFLSSMLIDYWWILVCRHLACGVHFSFLPLDSNIHNNNNSKKTKLGSRLIQFDSDGTLDQLHTVNTKSLSTLTKYHRVTFNFKTIQVHWDKIISHFGNLINYNTWFLIVSLGQALHAKYHTHNDAK